MKSSWLTFDDAELSKLITDKRIALVGSGPGVLDNETGYIDDSFDTVVRVSNFKLTRNTGKRVDIHYSFYGSSIKTDRDVLINAGVKYCIAKCPPGQVFESPFHRKRGTINSINFDYIYESKRDWWFCPTFIPDESELHAGFDLLSGHMPTTGFSALLLLMKMNPAEIYMTGFDFFTSKIHNVNEKWRESTDNSPIRHRPDLELQFVMSYRNELRFDKRLSTIIDEEYEP